MPIFSCFRTWPVCSCEFHPIKAKWNSIYSQSIAYSFCSQTDEMLDLIWSKSQHNCIIRKLMTMQTKYWVSWCEKPQLIYILRLSLLWLDFIQFRFHNIQMDPSWTLFSIHLANFMSKKTTQKYSDDRLLPFVENKNAAIPSKHTHRRH